MSIGRIIGKSISASLKATPASAGKKLTNQAVKAVSKNSNKSDYNKRRRAMRAVNNYANKALGAKGLTKERYLALAEMELQKARETYKTEKGFIGSKAFQKMLSVDNDRAMKTIEWARNTDENSKLAKAQRAVYKITGTNPENYINKNYQGNVKKSDIELAESIMQVSNISSSIYAGTVSIWNEEGIAPSERNQAIMEALGASSMLDVLQKFEDAGINLYATIENPQAYLDMALKIQELVLSKQAA